MHIRHCTFLSSALYPVPCCSLLFFYSYISASPYPVSMSGLSLLAQVQMHASLLAVAGETALTLAAGSGEQLTVQLLLEHGADISRCRTAGAQAIHTAAASGAEHHACMVLCCAVLAVLCLLCFAAMLCCAVLCCTRIKHGIAWHFSLSHYCPLARDPISSMLWACSLSHMPWCELSLLQWYVQELLNMQHSFSLTCTCSTRRAAEVGTLQ